jgi:hypothetical protein
LTDKQKERIGWHLSVAVCGTRHGVVVHLSLLSAEDLRLLCRYFYCGVDDLTDRFWSTARPARGRNATTHQFYPLIGKDS